MTDTVIAPEVLPQGAVVHDKDGSIINGQMPVIQNQNVPIVNTQTINTNTLSGATAALFANCTVGIAPSEIAKIIPENIRSGISILGVTGEYEGENQETPGVQSAQVWRFGEFNLSEDITEENQLSESNMIDTGLDTVSAVFCVYTTGFDMITLGGSKGLIKTSVWVDGQVNGLDIIQVQDNMLISLLFPVEYEESIKIDGTASAVKPYNGGKLFFTYPETDGIDVKWYAGTYAWFALGTINEGGGE